MVARSVLNSRERKMLAEFRKRVQKAGIPVEKMILYGSRARGMAKSWSDYDICVVSRKFGRNRFDELRKLGRLTIGIDSLIEPMPYHPRDLADKWDPLAAEIRKYGKTL